MEIRFKKPLSGIIPPLVTPLRDNETLDVESLERLIEHLIAGGVHGLFVLGTKSRRAFRIIEQPSSKVDKILGMNKE